MNYSALFPAWRICKCLISFEWITVRLSGLGPKTRQASAFSETVPHGCHVTERWSYVDKEGEKKRAEAISVMQCCQNVL